MYQPTIFFIWHASYQKEIKNFKMKKIIIRLSLFSAGLIILFFTVTFFGFENITLPNKIAWFPFWGAILITVVLISILAERW